MGVTLEYKCPNCGGKLEFDSGTQKMLCPYCDSTIDVEALKSYDESLNRNEEINFEWQTEANEWTQNEKEHICVYVCQSCGGEIVCDDTTAATHCPFCSNPVIMTGKLSGQLKPDFVIPFKLDKKAAKEALTRHFKGKTLLPKVFKTQNHIDEIKGIYVPFWLFDAKANADITYKGTRTRMWSDRNYNYSETSFYSVHRSGSLGFQRVPVDASSKMDDALMDSIEPFDFSEADSFKTAYLSGYYADRYDVDASESAERANLRIENTTDDVFRSTVHGFETLVAQQKNISLEGAHAKYALYPVWILNTTWNGKKYVFAINGQTGKIVGNLPVDKKKYAALLVGLTAAYGAAAFLISYLLTLF